VGDVLARRPQRLLIVGAVQDPGNLGAIVRVGEACGASGVIPADGSADPFGWKAIRASMGSIFRLPVAARQPLEQAASQARTAGLRVIAAVPLGGTPLPECDLRGPIAFMLGGEGAGLADEVVAVADERLTIPMQPPVESLNVAVAAGLILYEAVRQR
jgi:TrmH family RNA methyltransferase